MTKKYFQTFKRFSLEEKHFQKFLSSCLENSIKIMKIYFNNNLFVEIKTPRVVSARNIYI